MDINPILMQKLKIALSILSMFFSLAISDFSVKSIFIRAYPGKKSAKITPIIVRMIVKGYSVSGTTKTVIAEVVAKTMIVLEPSYVFRIYVSS